MRFTLIRPNSCNRVITSTTSSISRWRSILKRSLFRKARSAVVCRFSGMNAARRTTSAWMHMRAHWVPPLRGRRVDDDGVSSTWLHRALDIHDGWRMEHPSRIISFPPSRARRMRSACIGRVHSAPAIEMHVASCASALARQLQETAINSVPPWCIVPVRARMLRDLCSSLPS